MSALLLNQRNTRAVIDRAYSTGSIYSRGKPSKIGRAIGGIRHVQPDDLESRGLRLVRIRSGAVLITCGLRARTKRENSSDQSEIFALARSTVAHQRRQALGGKCLKASVAI